MQGQGAVCYYSLFLAVCSSSWDQLQAVPFSLPGSVWAQWLGNARCDIPKHCLVSVPSALCQPFRPPHPHPGQACSRGRFHVGFIVMEEEADLRSEGSVFRVAGQDCGSVQEEETGNLSKT